MTDTQPHFVLNLRVTFEELLALDASVNTSISGLRRHLDVMDEDTDDREAWERRLEIARSLRSKLDAYADDPVTFGGEEGEGEP